MKVYLSIALIWITLNLIVAAIYNIPAELGTFIGLSFIGLGMFGLIRIVVKLMK